MGGEGGGCCNGGGLIYCIGIVEWMAYRYLLYDYCGGLWVM